jgi:hypothetical protein
VPKQSRKCWIHPPSFECEQQDQSVGAEMVAENPAASAFSLSAISLELKDITSALKRNNCPSPIKYYSCGKTNHITFEITNEKLSRLIVTPCQHFH